MLNSDSILCMIIFHFTICIPPKLIKSIFTLLIFHLLTDNIVLSIFIESDFIIPSQSHDTFHVIFNTKTSYYICVVTTPILCQMTNCFRKSILNSFLRYTNISLCNCNRTMLKQSPYKFYIHLVFHIHTTCKVFTI